MNCEAVMPNVITIRKSVTHSTEDGTLGTKVIDVFLDEDTMMFSAHLPPYVAEMTSAKCISPIVEDTARDVISTYEVCCEEYSRWEAGKRAPTQLWIGTYTSVGDFARTAFGFTAACGIGATPVKVLPNDQMLAVLDDGSLGGPVGPKGGALQPVVVADTPEIRAKVKSLADSIQRAADILNGLGLAANPVGYLMAIGDNWQQPPLAKQAELDLKPVVTDDDEL